MKNPGKGSEAVRFRQKAEELLKKKPTKTGSQLSEGETLKLIHDLEVHQIELELQIEEIILAKEQGTELTTEKYAELYDSAPSGYFTLSKKGKIIELNLCGSQMLDKERSRLRNSQFGFFVSIDTKPIFNLFLWKVFNSKTKEICEVTLSVNDNLPMYVHLTGIVIENKEQCLITAIDITERKRAEKIPWENKSKYQTIFESTGTATLIVEEDTTITSANNECCYITGYTPTELIGQKWIQYVAPGSLQEMLKNHHLRRQDPDFAPKKYQVILVNKKGELRNAILNIGMIPGTKQSIVFMLDITELKRIEDELLISEKRYRTFIDSSPDYIFLKDEQLKHIVANKSYCRSYNKTEKEILGKTDFELMPEPFAVNCQISDEKAISMNGVQISEEKWDDKIFETVKFPVEYQKGKIGIGGFVRDITGRKQAEEAIQKSEEKWRKLVTTIPDYIALHDLKGRFIFLNHYAEGFFEKDTVGKSLYDFLSEDSIVEYRRNFDACLHTKQTQRFVYSAFGNNKVLRIYESYLVPIIEKDQIVNVMAIAMDITDRNRAEEKLQISEKKYRNLVENALIGIYSTNFKGKFLFANNAMCKMLEYDSNDEFINTNVISTYKNKEERKKFIEIIKDSKQIFNYGLELITKNGKTIDVIVNAFISGEVITGMMMDISERKQAEVELKKKLDELQRFHRLTVGRELTMIELKKEVNELLKQSGREEKYKIVE